MPNKCRFVALKVPRFFEMVPRFLRIWKIESHLCQYQSILCEAFWLQSKRIPSSFFDNSQDNPFEKSNDFSSFLDHFHMVTTLKKQ
eukprot:UN24011